MNQLRPSCESIRIRLVAMMAAAICAASPGALAADDSRTNAAGATIDACSLLRDSEIARATSLPIDEGVRRDAGFNAEDGSYSSTCVWTITSEESAPVKPDAPLGGRSFVILNAIQWPRGSGLSRTFLDAFREAAASGEIPSEPVPRDFGDEALWWGDGLAVRREDVSFGVSVFIPDLKTPQRGAVEEQLAPHILRRLDERTASSATL